MKRILGLLLSALMLLSLAACGNKAAPSPSGGAESPAAQEQTSSATAAVEKAAEPSAAPLSAWLNTKTGKFYSQFTDGMYMEYEMTLEGQTVTMVTATQGDKTYSETKMAGQSAGVTIIDGDTMITMDHVTKTATKMALPAGSQETVNTVIDESEVDPSALVSGSREVDGKTYATEEWTIEGAKSVLCFDGDRLAYLIAEYEGQEAVIKVIKTDPVVDKSLFEIPADYQVVTY